jgi:cell division protein FtsA
MNMLSKIINARMEEVIQQVYFEIRSSGYANKLIGGVVITGGGSQLKHLKQLVEYHTGLSARIGFPTEYLAKDTKEELKNPMYATGMGLIIKGIEEVDEQLRSLNKRKIEETQAAKATVAAPITEEKQAPIEIKETAVPEFAEADRPSPPPMKKKKDSWVKGLLTNVKDWFEDESVNKDFE